MPPELKGAIERFAEINGRSLNAEICARLNSTLEEGRTHSVPPVAQEKRADYALSTPESEMLALFRRWNADKQLAFLVLFK